SHIWRTNPAVNGFVENFLKLRSAPHPKALPRADPVYLGTEDPFFKSLNSEISTCFQPLSRAVEAPLGEGGI
ncbi:MAG TPA: hypothetical protein VF582_09480, partial [Allosphingosinicella sp.]